MKKTIKRIRKVFIAIIGSFVLLLGIVTIPYPGPGWLIVFAGLAILSLEFENIAEFRNKLKGKYLIFEKWLKQRNVYFQLFSMLMTFLLVVITLWLLNTFGILNKVLDLNYDWLISPFAK